VPRRRQWSLLSEGYQRRLLGAGISREDYEDGANLKKARGHSKTPENKRERIKKLAQKLYEKKERLRGDRLKWNGETAQKIILQGAPSGQKGEPSVDPLTERELIFLTNMSDPEFDDFLVDTDFNTEEYQRYKAAAYYH
jgi:hypothetical protein